MQIKKVIVYMKFYFKKQSIKLFTLLLIIVSVFAQFAPVEALESSMISYQGRLTDSSGNLLGGSNGTTYFFKFSFWTTSDTQTGSRVWPSSAPSSMSLVVRQGVFNVNIGDTDEGYPDILDYNFNSNQDIYLQVEVSSNNSVFETLGPRQKIIPSSYAQSAGSAGYVRGVEQSSFGTTTPLDNSIVTIQSTSTGSTALSLIASNGQAANMFTILDSDSNSLFSINNEGDVSMSDFIASVATTTSLFSTFLNATDFLADNATTTNMFATNLFADTFSLGSVNGLLLGIDGEVSAISTSTLFANYYTKSESDLAYDVLGTATSLIGTHESTYDHSLIASALQSESDPVYGAWDKSSGISITESQISDLQNYLTSFTETDPVYSAWDKSSGIIITESQISDLQNYLTSYTESDPIYSAWDKSTGIVITESQISDLQSYLTSYTETDPIFAVHDAYSITSTDITNLSNLSGTNTGDQDLSGLVPYTGATGNVDLGSNNLTIDTDTLFVDATNNSVGIGTTTPTALLGVALSSDSVAFKLSANSTQTSNLAEVYNSSGELAMSLNSAGNTLSIASGGIGYVNASSRITVGSATGGYFQVYGNTNGSSDQAGGAHFIINTSTNSSAKYALWRYNGSTWTNAWNWSANTSSIVHTVLNSSSIGYQLIGASNQSGSLLELRTPSGDSKLNFDINGTDKFAIGVDDSDSDKFKISGGLTLGSSDFLTITSTGDVGIGTTAPSTKLQISDSNSVSTSLTSFFSSNDIIQTIQNSTGGIRLISASNTSTNRLSQTFLRARGTLASPSVVQVDDILGDVLFGGMGSSSVGFGGGLFAYVDGTPTASAVPLRLSFVTGGSSSDRLERMTIKSNGNVGIGTTTPTQLLSVAGNAQFTGVTSGAYAFDLNLTSDGTLTTASSDERLKKNIVMLNSADILDKMMQLRPSQFDWKSNSAQDIGLIAQEVEAVFPELVFTNPTDGYKGINYSRISIMLISAVQELHTKIVGLFDGTGRANVKELCIEDVCISKAELLELLGEDAVTNSQTENTGGTQEGGDTSVDTSSEEGGDTSTTTPPTETEADSDGETQETESNPTDQGGETGEPETEIPPTEQENTPPDEEPTPEEAPTPQEEQSQPEQSSPETSNESSPDEAPAV